MWLHKTLERLRAHIFHGFNFPMTGKGKAKAVPAKSTVSRRSNPQSNNPDNGQANVSSLKTRSQTAVKSQAKPASIAKPAPIVNLTSTNVVKKTLDKKDGTKTVTTYQKSFLAGAEAAELKASSSKNTQNTKRLKRKSGMWFEITSIIWRYWSRVVLFARSYFWRNGGLNYK